MPSSTARRYAHYDYLRNRSLLSPRVGVTVSPFDANTHIIGQRRAAHARARRRRVPARRNGRTVAAARAHVRAARRRRPARRARALLRPSASITTFDGTYVVGVRRFQQRVDNQLVTLFGLPSPAVRSRPGTTTSRTPAPSTPRLGRPVEHAPSQRVRGSIDYCVAQRALDVARRHGRDRRLGAGARSAAQTEDVHDLTTSLETDMPQTATRVFFLYKMNNGVRTRRRPDASGARLRFDVQVNQALPFMPFGGTARWEVLVGLRNLFRDPDRRRLDLRRAPRRPAAKARDRRRPGQVLSHSDAVA